MFESIILRSLVEYMPQRVYAKDLEGRFVFANQAVARGMGVDSPYELIGRTDSDFYPAGSAAQYRREELEIMRSGRPLVDHEENVYHSLTGTTAYLLTTKLPLRDERGQVVGICITLSMRIRSGWFRCAVSRASAPSLASRTSKSFRKVPIISISASAFADDADRAKSAGANGFLTKPIDVSLLVDEMARHLNIRWAH